MSLSTLPDLSLLNIFHRVPVYDLLATVTLVCHRWNNLLPTACHQRKSLFVIDKNWPAFHNQHYRYLHIYRELVNEKDGSKMFEIKTQNNFVIVRKQLSRKFCTNMTQNFTRITHLKIIYRQTNVLQIGLVNLLLKKLSTNLRTLKIVFHTEGDRTPVLEFTAKELFHCCSSLFESINLQKNLHILDLSIYVNRYHRDIIKLSVDLPQLRKLKYNFWNLSPMEGQRQMPRLLEILNKNVEKSNLQDIIYWDKTTVPELLRLDPRLAIKVTKCIVFVWSSNLVQLDSFYTQFSSLKQLKLCLMPSITLNQIMHGLSQLTQLLHLAVFVNFCARTSGVMEDSSDAFPELNSVKVLSFDFVTQFHNQPIQFLKSIASLCPNVQVIVWQHRLDKCTECGYDFTKRTNPNMLMFDIVPQHQFDQCLRQTFRPMKRFERLRCVELWIHEKFNLFDDKLKLKLSKEDFVERFC